MTVSIITLSACGILAKSMENATDTLFKVIVPDSCEIQLIEKIALFRKDSLKIPDHINV